MEEYAVTFKSKSIPVCNFVIRAKTDELGVKKAQETLTNKIGVIDFDDYDIWIIKPHKNKILIIEKGR